MPIALGQAASAPDDISGAVTIILPPRRALRRMALLKALRNPAKLWARQPPRVTNLVLVALVAVFAGVIVATQLRPRGAERVGASVLAYVAPSPQEATSGALSGDRLAAAGPIEPIGPRRADLAPRCELPVVSVEELPVARALPPASPFATFASTPVEAMAPVEAPAPPKRPAKGARPKARRNIDDLVRKVIASDQKY